MKKLLMLMLILLPAFTNAQKLTDTTIMVNKTEFSIVVTDMGDYLLMVIKKGKHVVVNDTLDGFAIFELVDFNGDGHIDIFFGRTANVILTELYLYNSAKNTYTYVEDFIDYPDPKKIGISGYYYSYHRSGCADMLWTSDLFMIQDYKAVQLGEIYGNECDTPYTGNIYKFESKAKPSKLLIKTIPAADTHEYRDGKWGFIQAYWSKNYKRFK